MIAKQGHMAICMRKFFWLKSFRLREYHTDKEPLVVFGCYRVPEVLIIQNHKAPVIVIWMGKDSLMMEDKYDKLVNRYGNPVIHITWIKAISEFMTARGVDCRLVKLPVKEYPKPKTVEILGDKVYTYLPSGKPEYHGEGIINNLRIDYPLLVGDHSIDRKKWYNGESNKFYGQAFIGLFLSEYAGGAMSIQEMGVRGIRCVTNIMSLPNCIPWETEEDIERAIENEAERIGQSNNGLVQEMYDSMVDIRKEFNLEKLW